MGRAVGVEDRVEVDPFATTDGEEEPFFFGFGSDVGGADTVGGVGHFSEIHHRVPGGSLAQQRGRRVCDKRSLGYCVGLAGKGRE